MDCKVQPQRLCALSKTGTCMASCCWCAKAVTALALLHVRAWLPGHCITQCYTGTVTLSDTVPRQSCTYMHQHQDTQDSA